jgi:hypothetical protein
MHISNQIIVACRKIAAMAVILSKVNVKNPLILFGVCNPFLHTYSCLNRLCVHRITILNNVRKSFSRMEVTKLQI